MEWSQIVVAILGASAVVGAAVITIVYNKNLKLREEQSLDKKRAYVALIKTLDNARSGKPVKPDAMNRHAQQVVYFGSTAVLKAFGDYQQFIFSSTNDANEVDILNRPDAMLWMKLLGELMYQIRKDLGNLRWRDRLFFRRGAEKWYDALRPTITDIEDFVPVSYRVRRGRIYNDPPVMNGDKEIW